MISLAAIMPMEEDDLKCRLMDIQNGKQTWENENELVLIQSMLTHIGTLDRELRDNLIYGEFCKIIIEKQLDHSLVVEILTTCLSEDMLFNGIGETRSDTVFTRAFTTLIIALILYRNNEEGFLAENTILQVKDKLVSYMNRENDLRGFVAGKGWAHSVAHAADAFDELVKCKNLHKETYIEILNALWSKVFVPQSIYFHDEDERIINPIIAMLDQGLAQQSIDNLLQNLPHELEIQKAIIDEEKYWIFCANGKKFLKSFYVKLEDHPNYSLLQSKTKEILLKM